MKRQLTALLLFVALFVPQVSFAQERPNYWTAPKSDHFTAPKSDSFQPPKSDHVSRPDLGLEWPGSVPDQTPLTTTGAGKGGTAPAGGGSFCNGSLCVDNSDVQSFTGSTSYNFDFTTSGANRFMLAWVAIDSDSTVTAVNAPTYNGDATTLTTGNTGLRLLVYRLFAPDSGTHSLAVTVTGTGRLMLGAVSFTGAHQTDTGNNDTTSGTGTAVDSDSIVSAADEIVVCFVQMGVDDPAQTLAPGGDQTQLEQLAATDQCATAISVQVGEAVTQPTWVASGSVNWRTAVLGVLPS
jgi:hypothetical protein